MAFKKRYHYVVTLLISSSLFLSAMIAVSRAEITHDGSLGPAIALTGPDYEIKADYGQIQGSNLFHSFGEFNVLTGESATFTGPSAIQNILGRVTGGNQSFIDGLLRSTIDDANLFLLNPSGVIFGPNAILDVNGSFHVSTADFIRLGDDGIFYAALSNDSILTVDPPAAFGFLGEDPSGISIVGSWLQVPEGKTLSVVGGDIDVAFGWLIAPNGRINLASVASQGEVTLNDTGLGVGSFEQLGEINMSLNGFVSASGADGGTVFIRGGRLVIDNSFIEADTYGDVDGGGIDIYLTDSIIIRNGGFIRTRAFDYGHAGDISVAAGSFSSTGGHYTPSSPSGVGQGGNVTVMGGSFIASTTSGAGRAGDVTVTASKSVTISERDTPGSQSLIGSMTAGEGDAGQVAISAPTLILDDGVIETGSLGDGDAGDIAVEVGSLTLTGGARIDSSSVGAGKGGNLTVTATDSISISGQDSEGSASSLFSLAIGSGDAGHVSISGTDLIMGGGTISTSTFGDGRAGDITLEFGHLTLKEGAGISTSTFGAGQGGKVTVTATDSISISGQDSKGFLSRLSSISSGSGASGHILVSAPTLKVDEGLILTSTSGDGSAGDITLEVGRLTLTGGGGIDSSSFGMGPGGTVMVTATDSVSISGTSSGGTASSMSSRATGSGDAGRIAVFAPTLTLDDGLISATTYGDGQAGDIAVEVGSLTISGVGGILTSSVSAGDAGTQTIKATESVFIYGAGLSSSSSGSGASGSILISAPTLTVDEGLISTSSSGEGRGGDITLEVGRLALAGGGGIDSSSYGMGPGGTVTVTATDSVSIADSGGILSDAFGDGDAGMISIATESLTLDGVVTIETRTIGDGNAGDVVVDVGRLTLTDGAQIGSSSGYVSGQDQLLVGAGRGGRVTVTAKDTVTISGSGSGLFSNTEGPGQGGDITLKARDVELANGGLISAKSTGEGDAGNIAIQVGDTFRSRNSTVTTESKRADGGNIDLNVGFLVHLIDSEITASVGGGPETVGGNITIDPDFVILNRSKVIANAFEGKGGNIRIVAGVFLADPTSVVSASSALGIDGMVDIRAPVTNVSGSLAPLPKDFISAAELLREPCAARIRGGNYSSFVIGGRDGLPIEPGGLLPSPLYLEGKAGSEHFLNEMNLRDKPATSLSIGSNDKVLPPMELWDEN